MGERVWGERTWINAGVCVLRAHQKVKAVYDAKSAMVLSQGRVPAAYASCYEFGRRPIAIVRLMHIQLLAENGIATPIPAPRPNRAPLMLRVAAYAIKTAQRVPRAPARRGGDDMEAGPPPAPSAGPAPATAPAPTPLPLLPAPGRGRK